MKKLISMILVVLLLAGLGTAAMADGDSAADIDSMGIKLNYPAEYDELKGVLFPYPIGQIAYEPDVYYMAVYYFAMTPEEFETAMDRDMDEMTDEEISAFQSAQAQLCLVMACEDGLDAALSVLGVEEVPEGVEIREFGTMDNLHYFCIMESSDEDTKDFDAAYTEEFQSLEGSFFEVLKNAELYAPVIPGSELVGSTISFETTDLDGNPVNSKDLFAENEITLVNYWGTWCGACVGELAELAEIHTRLQEKGCGVAGILQDGQLEEKVELAKEIMAENGTNYPNVIYDESMAFLDDVNSYPTSFLVDRNGVILANPYSGAMVDAYEAGVDKLLAGETVSGLTMPATAANGGDAYHITVTDKDGKPIPGVMIQFCDDSSCNLGKTSDEGVASFDMPEGVEYIVHVLKVPEGYAPNNTEFHTLDVYSDLVIVLDEAA